MFDAHAAPARGAGAAAALPALALVFNAFVWGVSWWPFRALHAQGLHPLWGTAAIYLMALAFVVLMRPHALAQAWKHAPLWLLALSAGTTNVCFNWAVTIGDVVRVVLLFYMMPAWSVLLAWPLLGERPTAASLLRLVLALCGVAVVLGAAETGLPVPRALPDWLAILGGFSFALTNVLLRRLHAVAAPTRVTAMFVGGTTLAGGAAALGLAQGLIGAPDIAHVSGLALALGLGVAYLLGTMALQYGASRLAASTTALVMLSEVVFASASSVALDAAQMTPDTWIGGAMILAAAAWSAWPRRRNGAAKP